MNRQDYLKQMYPKNSGLLNDITISDLAYIDTGTEINNLKYLCLNDKNSSPFSVQDNVKYSA